MGRKHKHTHIYHITYICNYNFVHLYLPKFSLRRPQVMNIGTYIIPPNFVQIRGKKKKCYRITEVPSLRTPETCNVEGEARRVRQATNVWQKSAGHRVAPPPELFPWLGFRQTASVGEPFIWWDISRHAPANQHRSYDKPQTSLNQSAALKHDSSESWCTAETAESPTNTNTNTTEDESVKRTIIQYY